jgi:hypothetical protein
LDDIVTGFNGTVYAIVADPSGGYIVGGDFTSYNGDANCPNYLCKINADGTLNTDFNYGNAGFDQRVLTIAVYGAFDFIVGGMFTSYNGDANCPNYMCRITSSGTLDTGFNYSNTGFDNGVTSLVIDGFGYIIVGGAFTTYNGSGCPDRLCRVNQFGVLDGGFNSGGAGFNSQVNTIAIDSNGDFIVGGQFTSYNGDANCPNYLCKINADGTLNTSFNYTNIGFDGYVITIVLDDSDNVFAGGSFQNYNGSACPDYFCKINANGTFNSSFNSGGAGFNLVVYTIITDSNGDFMVGGGFTTYNGASCSTYMCRIYAVDGSLDSSFNLGGSGFNNPVYAIVRDVNNNFIVGGGFTSYNSDSECSDRFCMLTPTGALTKWYATINYYKEIGSFNIQYDDMTTTWTICGESFSGDYAGVDFSMSGNQVQYISSNITSVLVKSELIYNTSYIES